MMENSVGHGADLFALFDSTGQNVPWSLFYITIDNSFSVNIFNYSAFLIVTFIFPIYRSKTNRRHFPDIYIVENV